MPYTQITAQYQGFTGAPGWTRFKFEGSLDATQLQSAGNAVRTFLASLATSIPNTAKFVYDTTALVFTDAGELQSEIPFTTPLSDTLGSGSGAVPGGVGALVLWNTSAVHGGRKIRGRTYIAPLTAGIWGADGLMVAGNRTALIAAGNTLAGHSPDLVINSRKAAGGTAGPLTAPVISCSVSPRPCQLRSRIV